jgi:hypothetical protein
LSAPQQFQPSLVCEPCWSVREADTHPERHPTEHPRAVFIAFAGDLYAHRMVGFGNDGIETVCGQRWTNAGLTATFTGA